MEFLQATFYILWIVFLFGFILLLLTGFVFLFQIKKKADETMEYVKKQSDDVKEKVEGFVNFKRNEMLMKGVGFLGSMIWSKMKNKK